MKDDRLSKEEVEYFSNKTRDSIARFFPDSIIEISVKKIEKGFYEVRIQSLRSDFIATAFGRDPCFTKSLRLAKIRFLKIFFGFKGQSLKERRLRRRYHRHLRDAG